MTKRKSKTEVLASIDQSMETATTAGIVDHETQVSSWMPSEQAEEQLVEEVVQQLEAEAVLELEASEVQEPPADVTLSLDDILVGVPQEAVDETVYQISNEIDARGAFETTKNPDNENIHRTLKKVRSQMVTKRAARLLLGTSIDPSFINRSIHEGACYNVYALGKLADIIYGVTDGVVANAINLACMKSLFAFHKAGREFTAEMSRAAASDKIRVSEVALRNLLVRHTVSASTAPTQASSTMQALVTLGICTTSGSSRNPTYHLTDSPLSRRLQEKLAA